MKQFARGGRFGNFYHQKFNVNDENRHLRNGTKKIQKWLIKPFFFIRLIFYQRQQIETKHSFLSNTYEIKLKKLRKQIH